MFGVHGAYSVFRTLTVTLSGAPLLLLYRQSVQISLSFFLSPFSLILPLSLLSLFPPSPFLYPRREVPSAQDNTTKILQHTHKYCNFSLSSYTFISLVSLFICCFRARFRSLFNFLCGKLLSLLLFFLLSLLQTQGFISIAHFSSLSPFYFI